MAYAAILDAEIAPEAPITASLLTRLRDNALGYPGAPSGTKTTWRQSTAPLGWTKDVVHNDKALRVVSGSLVDGGTVPFSTCFSRAATDFFTLLQAHLPTLTLTTTIASAQGSHAHNIASGQGLHNHTGTIPSVPDNQTTAGGDNVKMRSGGGTTAVTIAQNTLPAMVTDANTLPAMSGTTPTGGTNTPFQIGMDIRVQYVDLIIATKD